MIKKFSSLLVSLAVLTVGPAAADILGAVKDYHCVQTGDEWIVPNERLFELALAGAGITLTLEERRMAEKETPPWSQFADAVLKTRGTATTNISSLSGQDRLRGELYIAAESLVSTDGASSNRLTVELKDPPDGRANRVKAFLMRQSQPWLKVRCAPPSPPATAPEARPSPIASALSKIQIGRDLAGASAGQLKNRSFALLSAKWDQEADQDSFSIEGVALYPALFTRSSTRRQALNVDFEFGPYLGFKRLQAGDPAKEINDLTFGGLTTLQIDGSDQRFLPAANYVDLSTEWISDDSLDSSMYRAELRYSPTWAGLYADDREMSCGLARCFWRISALADFAEVEEATGKPALLNVNQYGRIGADLSARIAFGPETAQSNWKFELQGSYQVRETFTDDDADADLFKARVAFVPSDSSLFSFGLDYVQGKDLISLVDQEYWALSIGVRK